MALYTTITATEKNNVITPNSAQTLEAISHTNTRLDFGIKWTGSDGAVSATWGSDGFGTGQPSVGLLPNTVAPYPVDFGVNIVYKNGHTWTFDVFPAISIDWAIGTLAGTIKELWYGCTYDGSGNVNGRTLLFTRDSIDPGYGAVGAGRPGPRYTFMLAGSEFRAYTNYKGVGQKPIIIQASPKLTGGMKFPMSLMMYRESTFAIEAVTIGASSALSTVYSIRDQTADFGAADVTFTADASTDVFTATAHGMSNDTALTVKNSGGALPAPLVAGTIYYVINATTNTFKLAAAQGGSAINITTNGTGTNTFAIASLPNLHLRIYQNGVATLPNGVPVDVDV